MSQGLRAPIVAGLLVTALVTSVRPASAQQLTPEILRNASYLFPISEDWWVTLHEGEYAETDEHGGMIRIWVEGTALGDIDGDGEQEAVVTLAWIGGGNREFLSLALVENWNGVPMHRGTARLPFAQEVRALEIRDGEVVATVLEPPRPRPRSWTDPVQVHRFRWTGTELLKVEDAPRDEDDG